MTMAYETITYAAPTKRTRIISRASKFDGMEVDLLHARVFRPLASDGEGLETDMKKAKHNIGQSARLYGKRTEQKFRVEIVEHGGAEVIAVWRVA